MFPILFCFLPFRLIPHMALLSETHLAYPIVFFHLVFFLHPSLYHLPQQAFASEYVTDPVVLPSPDKIHQASFSCTTCTSSCISMSLQLILSILFHPHISKASSLRPSCNAVKRDH